MAGWTLAPLALLMNPFTVSRGNFICMKPTTADGRAPFGSVLVSKSIAVFDPPSDVNTQLVRWTTARTAAPVIGLAGCSVDWSAVKYSSEAYE